MIDSTGLQIFKDLQIELDRHYCYYKDNIDDNNAEDIDNLKNGENEVDNIDIKIADAGGKAIDGKKRVLDLVPGSIHSRCPIFLGSKDDIEDVEKFYADFNSDC
ncbi:12071_t:CDS:2 [Entrophospora sp. SA101]|nr:12071_t:CDS:2 [Entrophospora sp. SA101]